MYKNTLKRNYIQKYIKSVLNHKIFTKNKMSLKLESLYRWYTKLKKKLTHFLKTRFI